MVIGRWPLFAVFFVAALPDIGARPAAAQSLAGIVIDIATQQPVAAADVVLLRGGQPQDSALSDAAGRFRLEVPTAGTFALSVRRFGYAAFDSDPITVAVRENVAIRVFLGQAAVPLDPLVITARTADARLGGFDERRASGAGRYITRAEIERRSAGQTSDLLRSVPSVQVLAQRRRGVERPSNMIAMRSAGSVCQPALFIDGSPVRQLAESTVDDILRPDLLEGVEIYASAATAPIQFSGPGGCGVILFWTRPGEAGDRPVAWRRIFVGLGIGTLIIVLAR